MLSIAKLKLQLDISRALRSDKVAKVFENALLSTFPVVNDENGAHDMAESFGKLCANGLSSALAQPITDAVDDYVKEIGLQITPTMLMSPTGPVTGSINPIDVKVL